MHQKLIAAQKSILLIRLPSLNCQNPFCRAFSIILCSLTAIGCAITLV